LEQEKKTMITMNSQEFLDGGIKKPKSEGNKYWRTFLHILTYVLYNRVKKLIERKL
jgi:hypothetical protein